ncbi:PAS domain S-box protein [Hymenobacter sp. BRD67]|uniref:PAS domain S-box protein n=1 Tax=Hymenobacter sp. BRD67 TaxID=2675877 RepID=UPI00156667F5|nr:PAS domain S-box protein [Hymenobacter sp. BRD67]QKG51993.1 PAS domain S-box protein [Hymenobacter sp. BRD67]
MQVNSSEPLVPATALLLDQLQLAYLVLDRDGRITEVNETLARLTGYSPAELTGQYYHQLLTPPAQQAERQLHLQEVMAGESTCQAYYELEVVTSSGDILVIQWQSNMLVDAQGQVAGLWAAGYTLRSQQPLALELSSPVIPEPTYLREFFDSSHDLILHLSATNNLLFINRAGQEKLDYTEEELLGRPLTEVVHPYYRAKLLYQLRRLYEGQALNKLETVLLTKAGRLVHLIGSVSSEHQPGRPPTARAVLHDITDRIKAERLQKVYYSIANLAISAHDLPALYGAIHRELGKVIETNNIFIALCDDAHTELQFVYYVDHHSYFEQGDGRPFSMGITEYVIEQGQPMFFTQADLLRLMRTGEMTAFGRLPAVLLASPLSVGDRIIGVLTVQEYDRADLYTPADLDILHFISGQVALAIDRKRQEEHLARQNARLNAIFESGSRMMWNIDRQGYLVSFNHNYAAFYKQHNGTVPMQGLNLIDNDAIQGDEPTRVLFREGYQAAARGESRHFEVPIPMPKGAAVWLSVALSPIYLPDGSFEEITAQAQDITADKNSQLVLAAQEEKFRSIFESFQDIYYRTDREGHFTILSPSVREVMGYNPTDVLRGRIEDFYWQPDQHPLLLRALATNNELRNFETQLRHHDGYPVSVLINARRTPFGTEGIARDITEIRRIQDDLRLAKEEAEAASAAKTQFLANMSHELRTPMNGIIGMIDLLSQTPLNAEQADYVDTLGTSSEALLTILNDILDLSKIQAGKMRLQEAPLALAPMLDRLSALFSYRASQKNIRFTYLLTPDMPAFVVTDETRLLQILANLVANAIKFTPQGTVTVVGSVVRTEGEFCTLRFAVQDSGIGISPNDAARLFTSFTQLDTTPSKAYGGTGLGLAISKELAELLGGTIGVLSNTGEGSIFWFTIRCQISAMAPVPEPAPELPAIAEPGASQRPHILLVDDNAINQKVAARLLAKLHCEVDVASDGYEAIARATAPGATYQLILMDIQMPGLDGIAATRAIKAQLGESSPPIVAMTAYSMADDAARFVQAGLDDYLAKPVKHQQLAQTLARWTSATVSPAAPAAPPVVASIIDPEVLSQLHQLGGEGFAAELYAEFVTETTALLTEADARWQALDLQGLHPLLHQLKGTAGTLGLTSLAAQALLLEQTIKRHETRSLTEGLAKLNQLFQHFVTHYPAVLTAKASTSIR